MKCQRTLKFTFMFKTFKNLTYVPMSNFCPCFSELSKLFEENVQVQS